MRRPLRLPLALAAVLALSGVPAGAVPVPVVASDNIELVTTLPESVGAISTAFAQSEPLMVVNTLNGLVTYDITDPRAPKLLGTIALPHFENEGMALGERGDTRFVLVGIDLYAVTPTKDPADVNRGGNETIIVDISDPAAPRIRGRVESPTSAHTVQCVGEGCTYAYTSGAYERTFTILDLTDLDAPKVVKDVPTPVAGSGGSGHQWTPDDAGLLWVAGWGGTAAFDVSDPLNPVPVASTDRNGTRSPYNDFIQHNVERPNAEAFRQVRGEDGRLVSGSKETASVLDGNVALITEEDYDSPDCQGAAGVDAPEGGFSTWYVPYLDAAQYASDNPAGKANRGAITPLDTWNTELASSGVPTPAGALCSAHYFTTHQDGFVAQGWYQQGTRILDVRDAHDIKQVGYFFTGASETWHAYWVPVYNPAGRKTGRMTDIVYTNDVARGIDVLAVDLPDEAPEATPPLTAPILPAWLQGAASPYSVPSPRLGYVCRIAR